MQVEWGASIPAGTVYMVEIDNAGKLRAERKGLPITPEGLTVATYQRTLPAKAVSEIRAAAEKFIRQLDFDTIQGRMVSDGGFASVEIWDGSATLSARLGLLRNRGRNRGRIGTTYSQW